MRKRFRDREAEKNGIVIRERILNNRTGRHKIKPGRQEANKIDGGGGGRNHRALARCKREDRDGDGAKHPSNPSETKLPRTVTAGSEPRLSLALSKTALKSPHSIVGTDQSAKSRHEVKNLSRSGFRLGA